MLQNQGIISDSDGDAIKTGLNTILEEIKDNRFDWREEDEDVHFNIERRLVELSGDAGKRLHTARSRNDQVATDLRLFVRARIDMLQKSLSDARCALLTQAEQHVNTLMPGMTHLQVAQPISFAHHMLAYEDMLNRDSARFADCRRRVNILPLGACALAGTGHPIDRQQVATALAFDGLCENSMDAVSDRDFAIEFTSAAAILMMHLSRFCEEVILWSSPAFGCITLADAFCTGSSIMPQKKNPDVPELIRGKCGRVTGSLTALLMLMKSQPLAYNKDNQEDKEPVFDCADTVQECTDIFAAMVSAINVKVARMRTLLEAGYPTATELADYLVKQGLPFRQAHDVVATIIKTLSTTGTRLEEMTLKELQQHVPQADAGALEVLSAEYAVQARNHVGGTAPEEIERQIKRRREILTVESTSN
jgi:argininosuccinate lyase